jgi:Na+/melibiose symporter-like transporter
MDRPALFRYGLLGMPLAFLALPLYVHLPNLYAREFGVPLAVVGALLFGVRLADAVIDPMLGVLGDRLFARSSFHAWRAGALAAAVLAAGFAAVMVPPALSVSALVTFAAAALLVTYLAFSLLTVIHQAWGAKLGGGDVAQSRIVGWRSRRCRQSLRRSRSCSHWACGPGEVRRCRQRRPAQRPPPNGGSPCAMRGSAACWPCSC